MPHNYEDTPNNQDPPTIRISCRRLEELLMKERMLGEYRIRLEESENRLARYTTPNVEEIDTLEQLGGRK